MKVLLTGGCGFIGSAVVRHMLRHTDHLMINVDKMTYAASEDALEEALQPRTASAGPRRRRRRCCHAGGVCGTPP